MSKKPLFFLKAEAGDYVVYVLPKSVQVMLRPAPLRLPAGVSAPSMGKHGLLRKSGKARTAR